MAGAERGHGAIAASQPYGAVTAAPAQAASVTRQAYDLLLDNFVTPPPPASLLAAAAAEVRKRVGDMKYGKLRVPVVPPSMAADTSRDEAWMAFDAWLDRIAPSLMPAIDRAALDDIAVRSLAAAV